MSKYKVKGVDQAKVNAELRELFGSQVSRADILAWREKSGIDPKWIRRNDACRVGRGLYAIPDGSTPVVARPPAGAKMAKRERAVLETPFDDGHYDGDLGDDVRVVPAKSKRIRKGDDDDPQALHNQPDYDPSIGERAAPVFVRAWVCDNKDCVGRKPGDYYAGTEDNPTPPTCECGSTMSRHSWAKKVK